MPQDVLADNFQTEVLQSPTPVLVDFWAPWCGPCKAMAPALEKLAEELGDQVKIVKCNVDEAQELASSLSVLSIPTFVLFSGGQEKARVSGAVPYEQFKGWVTSQL